MANKRKPIPQHIQDAVAIASRRRCCLCVFLKNKDEPQKGQLAHLNRDASDARFENLAFLCLEHHDDYDSRTSQSKSFSATEVRIYRDRLYQQYGDINSPGFGHLLERSQSALEMLPEVSIYNDLRRRFPRQLGFTSEPWQCMSWREADDPILFAYKSSNRADGVCLIETIDLPDDRIVVACIQIAGNPGQSVTNSAEELCFQVCETFNIPPEKLVWLEHYDFFKDDEWNLVTFERRPPIHPFENPTWTPMTATMWRDLQLRPRKSLESDFSRLQSKLEKLFARPTDVD